MEEPNLVVRWAIFLFAGGVVGQWSLAGIGVLSILQVWPGKLPILRPFVAGSAIILGLLLVGLSPCPLPVWFQFATCLWLAFVAREIRRNPCHVETNSTGTTNTHRWDPTRVPLRRWTFAASLLWLVTALILLHAAGPYTPRSGPTISDLLVIGDSVSAGLNDGETTWPQILARRVAVDVADASQPGATLKSARAQNALFAGRSGTVILEIGGNDLLESLPVETFEDELQLLLSDVVTPGRTVVMFELPLPPFCHRYGLAQRRLANLHQVSLVSKREFARLLTTRGATVDGIHLSSTGHSLMSKLVGSFLGKRLAAGVGHYERLERQRKG